MWLIKKRKMKRASQTLKFKSNEKRVAKYKKHWCMHRDENLKKKILKEVYNSNYSIHPGGDKFYKEISKNTFGDLG